MLEVLLRLDSKLNHWELLEKAKQLHRDNALAYEALAEENNQAARDSWIAMIGTNLSRISHINNKLGFFVKDEGQ